MAPSGGDAARRQARILVGSWIDRHDSWDALIWRPDVLGLRIANWLGTHDFFCASADDRFRARIFASLSRVRIRNNSSQWQLQRQIDK